MPLFNTLIADVAPVEFDVDLENWNGSWLLFYQMYLCAVVYLLDDGAEEWAGTQDSSSWAQSSPRGARRPQRPCRYRVQCVLLWLQVWLQVPCTRKTVHNSGRLAMMILSRKIFQRSVNSKCIRVQLSCWASSLGITCAFLNWAIFCWSLWGFPLLCIGENIFALVVSNQWLYLVEVSNEWIHCVK